MEPIKKKYWPLPKLKISIFSLTPIKLETLEAGLRLDIFQKVLSESMCTLSWDPLLGWNAITELNWWEMPQDNKGKQWQIAVKALE